MVLLPKTRSPEQAKDTRPIAIGCAAEKVYCRIILERTRHHITLRKPWQCAGARRQTCDFLYTLHKLFEEEREWSKGLCILKVDFKRAFDTVDRNRLLARLWELKGDSEEYRTWERLMTGTTFTMRSPWGQSTFHSTTGIRQGSIESPAFFGVLVEWVLEEILSPTAGRRMFPRMETSISPKLPSWMTCSCGMALAPKSNAGLISSEQGLLLGGYM